MINRIAIAVPAGNGVGLGGNHVDNPIGAGYQGFNRYDGDHGLSATPRVGLGSVTDDDTPPIRAGATAASQNPKDTVGSRAKWVSEDIRPALWPATKPQVKPARATPPVLAGTLPPDRVTPTP